MEIPELIPSNIQVRGARTLLDVYKQAKKTTGGLELSQGDGNVRPSIGQVLKVGELSEYKVGEILVFRRYAADLITIDTPEGPQEICLLDDIEVLSTLSAGVEAPIRGGKYEQINNKQDARKKTARSLKDEGESPSKEGRKKDN